VEHLTLLAKIRKHSWYYGALVVLQVTGLVLVFLSASDKSLQLTFMLLTAALYIFWSLLHQFIHHTLTAKIAAEYVLFGLFGIAITYFVL
jgi:hypothetical protein